jgi:hypothetical protein
MEKLEKIYYTAAIFFGFIMWCGTIGIFLTNYKLLQVGDASVLASTAASVIISIVMTAIAFAVPVLFKRKDESVK